MAVAGCITLALMAAAALLFLTWKFPLRREAVIRSIAQKTQSRVEIGSFETKWFPPRFTARGVKISRPDGVVLTIGWAAVSATYTGLLRSPRRLHDVEATDVHLVAPAQRLRDLKMSGGGSGLAVRYLHITKAGLDLTSGAAGHPPLQFVIHSLAVRDLGAGSAARFRIAMHNPKPSGDIRSEGSFGPFDGTHPLETPLSGSFTFEHADIAIPRAIAGTLDASGTFHGPLRAISCTGTADVPAFQVYGSSNSVHLSSRFDVTVNARNGDVVLNRVLSHFDRTTFTASGSIAHEAGAPGKLAKINVDEQQGTVEDLLILFTRHKTPAMKGSIDFRAVFTIPPGPARFLSKLGVQGAFHIHRGYFTNPKSRSAVDRLTSSARGEPKRSKSEPTELATADVDGKVSDPGAGIVHLSDIDFRLPGTSGEMDGTFGLYQKDLRFKGRFETEGKLADTTYGFKSAMLKVLSPLWRKRNGWKSVPFDIGGTASQPRFRLRM